MKKLSILLLSALALGITTTSCTKDDDNKSASASIVGKWTINSYTITNSTGTSEVRSYDPDPTCTDKSFYDLKTGNTMNEHSVGDDSNNPCTAADYAGTYTFNNNILNITQPGSSLNYTVVSMTSTKMITSKVAGGETYTYTLTRQ